MRLDKHDVGMIARGLGLAAGRLDETHAGHDVVQAMQRRGDAWWALADSMSEDDVVEVVIESPSARDCEALP